MSESCEKKTDDKNQNFVLPPITLQELIKEDNFCLEKAQDGNKSTDSFECNNETKSEELDYLNNSDSDHQENSFFTSESYENELICDKSVENHSKLSINEKSTIESTESQCNDDDSSFVENSENDNLNDSNFCEAISQDEARSTSSNNSTESSDDDDYNCIPDVPKPSHKWNACKEVLNRQYGTSNRYINDLFRLRNYGSLYTVEHLQLFTKLACHEGCVNALHFNNTGNRLVSGSDDLNIVIWDWAKSTSVLSYESGHRNNVFQAKFLPLCGDCHIVSCGRDGQIRLGELSTTGLYENTKHLAQHRGGVHKLALELDSPHTFLSCGEDAVVFEIDLREEKPEKLIQCTENEKNIPLYSVFVNPNKSYEFALGGRDCYIRIYDKRYISNEGKPMNKYCPRHLVDSDIRADVTSVVYNYNGHEILASYNDEDIYTFDLNNEDVLQYKHKYRGHRNNHTVKNVNYFGPKSEYIISGSDCSNIYFWDSDTEHIVQCLNGVEADLVNCLEPHPSCPILATSGLRCDIKIWMPSSENLPNYVAIKDQTSANLKERQEEIKRGYVDGINRQMWSFFVQNIRLAARRRARQRHQDDSNSNDTDSEDELEVPHIIQCTQS
ncbi:DDB1- and CUL4-associated factor 8-like [Centruroides sculpturatus]|uniref:DDB1- and CUL4-associated factor 8-like n=1 Tax=Centruroides sculpturatus TaxID=218467 RepID=UPI000C6D5D12|nr:DDB1- and CUL4-associated factor 8-like [Centruroides sculpturatus]XP_023216104.1 DDB1- and CUL4-associated factor 8-like [Centruroides sculpturatus]